MKTHQLLFILSLLFVSQIIKSQETPISARDNRVYTTKSIENKPAPIIDGLINEESWNIVEWTGDFVENEPDENTEPHQQTKFKIVYDEKNLYVAIRAFDTAADSIINRLSRRDGFVGDRVNLVIDSYYDKRTAFIFTVTAAGVKGDEIATNNGDNVDDSWNPIWYTKTTIDDEGWTAEMKIPLSQLRFGNNENQVWGLNVARKILRKNDLSIWDRVPQDAAGFVSEMGELHGLINIKPQQQLEIQPFVLLKQDVYPAQAGNPFRDGSDFKLNGGLDAKIGITNDLTLDLTVNPDFGQVEADPGAIALDGFQLFFEEQRPFFVENKNIFDYQFANNQDNLFYSRRIGRRPQGGITSVGGDNIDRPINSTILGAAKFSGKTKNGWSIGLLESITSKEIAFIENSNGDTREAVVEPMTNYLVVRAQKDFNDRNTFVGGIFTATNRNLDDTFSFSYDNNQNEYVDEEGAVFNPFTDGRRENNLKSLTKAAYTGGLDFRHNWKDRKYYIEGNLVGSYVTGSEEAITNIQQSISHLFQREDATHVEVDQNRTSLSGTGGKLTGGKASGGHWRYNAGVFWRSPELELNDIGFLRQADDIRQFTNINWRTLKPSENFRSIWVGFEQSTAFDYEGNYNRIQYQLNGNVNYNNNWWSEMGLAHKPRIFVNTFLRGGPRWRFSQENFGFVFSGTDRSKKFYATLGYVHSSANQDNFKFIRYVMRLNYQPLSALSFSLNTEFEDAPSKTQYVTTSSFNGAPRYITSAIDQKTLSTTLRVNYSLNPNLSIQYYAQPFIARGTYSNFNYVNQADAQNLDERITLYNDNQISFNEVDGIYNVDEDENGSIDYSIGKPDFAFVQFRSNLVMRWEYIPGSEVFFVWSQGVTGFGNPENDLFDGLENQILKKRPDNTFLIKATYRFIL